MHFFQRRRFPENDANGVKVPAYIPRARAVAAPRRRGLGRRLTLRENPEQSGARRSRQLARPARPVRHAEPLEEPQCRRSRNRKDTMSGFDRAISESDAGIEHGVHAKQLETPDRANDVENRVDGPHLVQMQLFRRHAVNLTLHRPDRIERGVSATRYVRWDCRGINERVNFGNSPAVRLRWNVEINFHAADTRSFHVRNTDAHSAETKELGQPLQPAPLQPDVDQGAEEHVTGNPAGWINDYDFH